MRALLEDLPDADLSDAALETDLDNGPLLPPDDGDLVRPFAEEELERFGESALARARTSPLAKHLVWTFGPLHPALPFLIQLRCEIEDDRLVTVDPEVGWSHQGLEKSLESTPWADVGYALRALHPDNPVGHQLAWLCALELLCGMAPAVPRAAQIWRVVMAELSRCVDHLVTLGVLADGHMRRRHQDIFSDALRIFRELLAQAAFEGEHLRTSLGGLVWPPTPDIRARLRHHVAAIGERLRELAARQRANPAVLVGLRHLGILDRPAALSYAVTGPAARAAGVVDDLRVNDPYFAYEHLRPDLVVGTEGDVHARFEVRLDEVVASCACLMEALAAFDAEEQGPARCDVTPFVRADGSWHIPPGRARASVELANGELGLLVSSEGGPHPARVRIRTPSFFLASVASRVLTGAKLDEVEPVLASLGILGAEVDR